jgi:ubiquinone biosynthesis protein
MFDWQHVLDQEALADVLPREHARFARPICEGLALFLGRLPQAAQAQLLAQQSALPSSAGVSERLGVLAQGCPVLQKLGQILARDPRLAPELRRHLRVLESLPPTVSVATLRRVLTAELGPLRRLGIRLLPPALAEASVGVVIPFQRIAAGRDGSPEGVFKVLKPGIDQRLELELDLLGEVGAYLDERCETLQIPHLDYEETFQQVRDKLRWEIQLDQEQRHLAQAARFYADEPRVQIPALLEFCTPRVTAMERIDGCKVTDHRLDDRHQRRELADLVVRALITRPIFSRARQAMFHCDPHAGNLFLTDRHRLAILDWSLVGSLENRPREAIMQIMLAAAMLDAPQIVAVLESLSERQRPHADVLAQVVQKWLARIRAGQLPGLTWLTGMLDEAVRTARLRVATDLLLFRKSLLMLEGVLAEVNRGAPEIDDVLLADFCHHFITEWPRRWFASFQSREFATRLSNADLTRVLLSWPSTATKLWLGPSLDSLSADRLRDNLARV